MYEFLEQFMPAEVELDPGPSVVVGSTPFTPSLYLAMQWS